MRLYEPLQICLIALEHRRPIHVIDINETLLGPQQYGSEGWYALDIIELLETTAPTLLQAPALLVLDSQETFIYLVDRSQEMPAFWIHCQGKIPPYQGNMAARKQKLLSPVG